VGLPIGGERRDLTTMGNLVVECLGLRDVKELLIQEEEGSLDKHPKPPKGGGFGPTRRRDYLGNFLSKIRERGKDLQCWKGPSGWTCPLQCRWYSQGPLQAPEDVRLATSAS